MEPKKFAQLASHFTPGNVALEVPSNYVAPFDWSSLQLDQLLRVVATAKTPARQP